MPPLPRALGLLGFLGACTSPTIASGSYYAEIHLDDSILFLIENGNCPPIEPRLVDGVPVCPAGGYTRGTSGSPCPDPYVDGPTRDAHPWTITVADDGEVVIQDHAFATDLRGSLLYEDDSGKVEVDGDVGYRLADGSPATADWRARLWPEPDTDLVTGWLEATLPVGDCSLRYAVYASRTP